MIATVVVVTDDGLPTAWKVPPEVMIIPDRATRCKACGRDIVWAVTIDDHRRPYDQDGTNHYGTCPSRQSPAAMR